MIADRRQKFFPEIGLGSAKVHCPAEHDRVWINQMSHHDNSASQIPGGFQDQLKRQFVLFSGGNGDVQGR